MNNAFVTFQKYMGTGLITVWFLVAVIFLLVWEKRRPRRILFVYMPVIVLLCFFNPLFAGLFGRMGDEATYFRVFWLLPVTAVISYSAVLSVDRLKGKRAVFFAVLCLGLIAVSGKPVYSNSLYSRAENIYHVPDSVVEICDAIEVPGREVMAAFPPEMILYVRQYSPVVCMPYGREVLMGSYDEFYTLMREKEIDLERLVPLSREKGCHYVVFGKDSLILGEPADYGWSLFYSCEGYDVWRDNAVPLIVPEGY